MRQRLLGCLAIVSFVALARGESPSACERLATLAIPNATITRAERIEESCRVAATLRPSSDSEIQVEVWLPAVHWKGPNTFDLLGALEQWVESGRAPDQIVASHATKGVVDRTRPLCPYPEVATYTGTGSTDQAANFSCR
jgi:hypothetical protein